MPDVSMTREQRTLLIAVTLSVSVGVLDFYAVSVALPSIQRDLNISSTDAEWAIIAFAVMAAATVAIGGRIVDTVGPHRVYLVGVILFSASSMICGTALNVWWLIIGRSLQGVSLALFSPAGVALITTQFATHRRGRALGTVGAIGTVALLAGPVIGGAITESLGWRWIFFINIPMVIAIVILSRAGLAESRGGRLRDINILSLLLFMGGLFTFVLALTRLPDWGVTSPASMGLLIGTVACFSVFFAVEHRVRRPLMHLAVLRNRGVAIASTVGFCVNFASVAFTVYGLIYFQVVFGLSPLEAGLAVLPAFLPGVFFERGVGRLADTVGPAIPMVAGLGALAISMVWVSAVAQGHDYLALLPPVILYGVGYTLVNIPARVLAQEAVAKEEQGGVAGLTATFRYLGRALGVASVGALIVAIEYSRGIYLLSKSGIRVDGDDRAVLLSLTVDGRTGSSELAEIHHKVQFEHAAHAAFSFGFSTGMRLAAVMAVVAVVAGLVLLGKGRRASPFAAPRLKLDEGSG